MALRILLEGRPGVGKTTVAGRLVELCRKRGIRAGGFLTRELREGGRRVGFAVEALDGGRATLAHVELEGPPRVGRYGVDLEAFECVALPALEPAASADVVVIDELGKMELASERLRAGILRLLETPLHVVATVHVFRHPLTDALKERGDVERLTVTHASRGDLPERIAERLAAVAGESTERTRQPERRV